MDDTPSRFAERLISADVGTWDYDPNRDRLFADPAFARLLGLSDDAADGGPLANVLCGIHADDRGRMAAAFEAVLRTSQPFAAQFRTLDREGRERSVVGRARIRLDGDGRIARMPGILIDVTDGAGLEQRLRDSEARGRLALDAAGLGTWSVTPERVLNADRRFSELFAGDARSLDVDGAAAMIHPEDREAVTAAVVRATRPEAPLPYDRVFRVRHPGTGRERWVQAIGRTRRVDGPAGARPLGLDGVLADVTDRRLMERAQRQLASDLADADRRKNEFLAMLAHELRNPLAPVSNALELLSDVLDDAQAAPDDAVGPAIRARTGVPSSSVARTALDTLERQFAQLTRLVDDLMDVSRISHGTIALDRQEIRLRDVLTVALETTRPLVAANGHRLRVAIPATPVPLKGDITRLAQVFVNLLNNAVKFSPGGSTIELRVERGDDDVRIAVRDNGIGLRRDELERIFEMFVQVDASTSRVQDGLGIGLALVRRFVGMHGGRVEVHSDGPGRGSEFRVHLPIVKAGVPVSEPACEAEPVAAPVPAPVPAPVSASVPAPGADPGGVRSPRATAAAKRRTAATTTASLPPSSTARLGGRRVLVVDDNEDGANTWVAVLELRGMRAQAVHDGIAALRVFGEFGPDVVLLDVGMPGIDGLETCRRLRRLPGGMAVHVIAVTGWGSSADQARTREAGFDSHLVKPVKVSQMLTLLAALPGERRSEPA